MPAIITLAIISSTMQTLAMSLVIAREDGRLKRGRGTPMPAWVFIAGRIGNSIVVALMMLALLAAIGGVFYGVAVPWERLPAILLVLVVGAASFCCLGIALTAAIPSQDAAAPIVNALLLPLYFLSGVFIPEDQLPNGVIHFADLFPIRHFFEAFFDAYVPAGGPARRPGTTSPWSRSGGSPACCSRSGSSAGPRATAERSADRPTFRAVARIASGPDVAPRPPGGLRPRAQRRVLRRAAGALGWRRHSRRTGRSAGASPSPSSSSPHHHEPASRASACSASPGSGIVAVKAAWEAGVTAGGNSVAEPGERRSHGSGSYSAFLKDPDGYEIEVTIGTD